MRVLVVAPMPPRRDGIAAYAATQAARLREEGDQVTTLAPPDGEADHHAEFFGGGVFAEAGRLAPDHDRVVVHFQPSLYFPPRKALAKIRTARALLRLAKATPNLEILVHEADPPIRWRPDYVLLGRAFRAAPALLFHTDAERRTLEASYGPVRGRLVDHGQGIRVGAVSRADARRRLGLDPGAVVFVAPGFIHPDKGFDRAVDALARLDGPARLDVVGSVRDPSPENVAYASRLREACGRAGGATLHEGFVSDEDLDAWIAAADAVVLPYRRSWSSGMLARAQALGTPAIVARTGGLPEQAREGDTVFDGDEDLVRAMAAAAARAPKAVGEAR